MRRKNSAGTEKEPEKNSFGKGKLIFSIMSVFFFKEFVLLLNLFPYTIILNFVLVKAKAIHLFSIRDIVHENMK